MNTIESHPQRFGGARRVATSANCDKRPLAAMTAMIVTTAAFAKLFLPFYLIGSTAIFAIFSAFGATRVATSWLPISHLFGILIFHALFCDFRLCRCACLEDSPDVVLGAAPPCHLLMLHISARGALVSLVYSLTFLTVADLWVLSKKITLLSIAAAIVVVAFNEINWARQRANGLLVRCSMRASFDRNSFAQTDSDRDNRYEATRNGVQ